MRVVVRLNYELLEIFGASNLLLDVLHGRLRILDLLHLLLVEYLAQTVDNLEALLLKLLFMVEGRTCGLDECLKRAHSKLCKYQTLGRAILYQDTTSLLDWAHFSGGEDAFLCHHRNELFVGVHFRKDRRVVNVEEDGPSVIRLQTIGTLV